MKATVVMNEVHALFPEQIKILNKTFDEWDFQLIPAKGLTEKQIDALARELSKKEAVVLISFIPLLVKRLIEVPGQKPMIFVFHHNKRHKRLPRTGWKLL